MADSHQDSDFLKVGRQLFNALKDPVEIRKTREYFNSYPHAKENFQRDLWALQLLLEKIGSDDTSAPFDVDRLLSLDPTGEPDDSKKRKK